MPPRPQVNAFCNTDDITWGTKNLDTKKEATQTKSLLKSSIRYAGGWAACMCTLCARVA